MNREPEVLIDTLGDLIDSLEDLVNKIEKVTEYGPVGEAELDRTNFKEASRFRTAFENLVEATENIKPILEALR